MDSVIAFFQNEQFSFLLALFIPILYKYLPVVKNFTNKANTFLAVFAVWFAKVFVPPAEASIFSNILSIDPVFPSLIIGLSTKLVHELVLSPLFKAIGIKTPVTN